MIPAQNHKIVKSFFIFTLVFLFSSGTLFASAIHDATRKQDLKTIQALIKAKNCSNALDKDDLSALHIAAQNGYLDVAKLLIANGANVNVVSPSSGLYPLHLAVRFEKEKLVELLLQYNAFVNATDNVGMTPLHYAVIANNKNLVKLLLDAGANAAIRDKLKNRTPLDIAKRHNYSEISTMILTKIKK